MNIVSPELPRLMNIVSPELPKRDHGNYPASIDALVPQYFDVVPVSAFSGLPMTLKQMSKDEAKKAANTPDEMPRLILFYVGTPDGPDCLLIK